MSRLEISTFIFLLICLSGGFLPSNISKPLLAGGMVTNCNVSMPQKIRYEQTRKSLVITIFLEVAAGFRSLLYPTPLGHFLYRSQGCWLVVPIKAVDHGKLRRLPYSNSET